MALSEPVGCNLLEMIQQQPSQPFSRVSGNPDWTLADVIDFEVLIQEDAEAGH